MSDALVSQQILRGLWSRLLPKLAYDERMTLTDRGGIDYGFDGWRVQGHRFRVRRDGSLIEGSLRHAAVDIPCRDLVMTRGDLRKAVDIVSGHLRYLIALLRPPIPSLEWRKFNRRSR